MILRTKQPSSNQVLPQDVIDYIKEDVILKASFLKIFMFNDQRRKELIGVLLQQLAAQKLSDELGKILTSLLDADFVSKVMHI